MICNFSVYVMCEKIIIIIIDEHYFDVTKYVISHPGGKRILKKYHMKDATYEFNSIKGHGDAYAIYELAKYCIGNIHDVNIHDYIEITYTQTIYHNNSN